MQEILKKGGLKALTEDFENYEQAEFATSTTIYILQHFQPSLKKNHSEHYLKNTVMGILTVE
ncbi:MAG: hypothetical protein OXC46_04715 [Thaumarchaeota archaeon]|nr:hypothetical protein [Nitrososphaerota archaeon]